MRTVLMVVACLLAEVPAAFAGDACTNGTAVGAICSCDVSVLRPLQGAIGLDEVRDKQDTIEHDPETARKKLGRDPIKVVHGLDNALFITDHHHGADAWRLAGQFIVPCQIADGPPSGDAAAFWQGLAERRLVHLEGADGQAITPEQLPQSLAAMPDDPYRSLAWRLRKARGFCRKKMAQIEFAEFVWADWMRARPELPASQVGASTKSMLPAALALARSPAAAAVPGYVGSQAGAECADES